jgi:hypothetical protein
MAIPKVDLMTKLTAEQDAQVARIEAFIDEVLRKDYVGNKLTVSPSCQSIHQRVRAELTRRYSDAGWEIEFKDEQRDGLYITIK